MRLRLILLLPLLLLLALFVASNTIVVPIGLWPTGLALQMPLALALLAGMALAFLTGALLLWMGSLGARRRARRAEARIAVLENELLALRDRIVTP